jgi:hypothetical protein
MSDKKSFPCRRIIISLFFILPFASHAQNDTAMSPVKGEYSLVVYTGGGLTSYVSKPGVSNAVDTRITKGGFGGSLRIMWHPDHLLRFGIESGLVPFYSYTFDDGNGSAGKLAVSAIPVIFEWSMPLNRRFNIFLGYGIYLLKSRLDFEGTVNSSSNSLGYLMALNYIQPLSANLGLVGEVKWMNASETKDHIMNFQVQLVWKFFKW